MRFLFASQGYPGVRGTSNGSGIGTYVREISLGLTARGHECHVLAWSEDGSCGCQCVDGVTVHLLPRRHRRFIERWWPDTLSMRDRVHTASVLDSQHCFDWIEIQSDEGIDLSIQKAFRGRAILRVHTTLHQMCSYKRVTENRLTRIWLARERDSLHYADKIVTHSQAHAEALASLFPGLPAVRVVPHGFGDQGTAPEDRAEGAGPLPRFLMVGTFDLRKGTDRLWAVMAEYAAQFGPCEFRLVSPTDEMVLYKDFDWKTPYPTGVKVTYLTRLDARELELEYRSATAYLHLARYESFGYPLIEAASHGTPIVATPTGIAPDLLSGSLSAFIADGDNPVECALSLHRAAQSRETIGRELQQRYGNWFTRGRMTESYLALLDTWFSDGREK